MAGRARFAFVEDLAAHQAEVEGAGLEPLGIVGRALGVEAAQDEAVVERLDRQLRYFSDIGDSELTPSRCQERLREAKIAVLGVGGLGGWSAWALACTGVGEMWLIDGDVVEISNLNRQILYTEADIGQLKVERAAERLRAFNSGCRITTAAERLESEGSRGRSASRTSTSVSSSRCSPARRSHRSSTRSM